MNFLDCNVGLHNVFHRGTYKVLCKSSTEEVKKELTFLIEKYSESSHLKVIISDEKDPCFLCVLVVTRSDYDELKKQQGLLIDFDSFPAQLVRLLQQSVSGNMFLLLQQQTSMNIFLEIIEHNEFKRLVHLSLKTGPASDSDIKRNMADNILILKKKIADVSTELHNKENIFQEKEQILQTSLRDLNLCLNREKDDKLLRETEFQEMLKNERDKLDLERKEWKRCAELCAQTQANSTQEALSRKEKLLEDSSTRCRQLQETLKSLESQIVDKGQRIISLEKQLHTVRADAETWRHQNGALDREYHDKELNLQQTRARLMDAEKTLKDKSDMLRDALDSLQSIKREKITLEEKLGTYESLASKYQTEAKTTGEQLLKANQIIAKQNSDILEMREKLMCRTAIALEQEKVIDRNSAEIAHMQRKERDLNDEIDKNKTEIGKLKSDIEAQKCLLVEKDDTIKSNHSVIQWLHKKLDTIQSNEITIPSSRMQTVHSSTPFLSSHVSSERHPERNNNEMLNAYTAGLDRDGPSQASTHKYLPGDEAELSEGNNGPPERPNQYSLDPIYLRPNNYSSRTSTRSKSQDSAKSSITKSSISTAHCNKENRVVSKPGIKNYQPPKGNLKKKDDRNVPSPISAYFPRP